MVLYAIFGLFLSIHCLRYIAPIRPCPFFRRFPSPSTSSNKTCFSIRSEGRRARAVISSPTLSSARRSRHSPGVDVRNKRGPRPLNDLRPSIVENAIMLLARMPIMLQASSMNSPSVLMMQSRTSATPRPVRIGGHSCKMEWSSRSRTAVATSLSRVDRSAAADAAAKIGGAPRRKSFTELHRTSTISRNQFPARGSLY